VRSATTLGIVGAGGGIGQTLCESIRSFQYAETAAQVIIVVVAVVTIDMLSARIRKHLV
jgi:phosphonate transport system permease protein